MLGSIVGDFEDLVVRGPHCLRVREPKTVGYCMIQHSHTATVYNRGANEKKDAPYKICRKSVRKVEATR